MADDMMLAHLTDAILDLTKMLELKFDVLNPEIAKLNQRLQDLSDMLFEHIPDK